MKPSGTLREPKPAVPCSRMAQDIADIPSCVERQLRDGLRLYEEEAARWARMRPRVIITCARGSSRHAATYFKYLMEMRVGIPVAPIGPSVASVYGASLSLDGAVCLSISQSGGSPDLAALQESARAGGARATAVVNTIDSPLAAGSDHILPIFAGQERAVPATRSFVGSLVVAAALVAAMSGDAALRRALNQLPDSLHAALRCDWSAAGPPLARAPSLFVIGRGPGLAVVDEAALKLKEVCGKHAEAFSAAEALHGPVAVAQRGFAALAFLPEDAGRDSCLDAARSLREGGAEVIVVGGGDELATPVDAPNSPHPLLEPICQIAAFYQFAEWFARLSGADPDSPPRLSKVVRTR